MNLPATVAKSIAYKRGYSEGRRGYGLVNPYERGTPHAADFAAGHADGKRRRSKTGKSKASTFKDANKAIEDRWGCITYRTAKRCPKCGGMSLKRLPKSDECFGCVLREAKESVNA